MKAGRVLSALKEEMGECVEGLVVRRAVGGRVLAHRPTPDEEIDPRGTFDLVALVAIDPTVVERLLQ